MTTNGTTGTTEVGSRPAPAASRPGVSVRVRITTAFAVLVAATLVGSGVLVYVIQHDRLNAQTVREVDQEFDEFSRLAADGVDPETGQPWGGAAPLLETFMERNVPDDDERLVGWVGDSPTPRFYSVGAREELEDDAEFLDAAAPLRDAPGSVRIGGPDGERLISSQPIQVGGESGALIVVNNLTEDRTEITSTMQTYAVVSALSLLLIVVIAFWQAGRLLRPLRALRQTADEITETDLERRLPLTGNDDVTALTRTFNGMLDRLESAFVGQRQLLDDAGHELRTPLTVLQGHLELLDAHDPVEVEETRAMLLDEIDRMRRLVDDLILLAKSEHPGFLDVGEVDAATLTRDVLAKASGLADREWALDETASTTVTGDGHRITQAVLQLADNAVKHTGPGDTIAIGSTFDGQAVLWWVRDTGSGVDPADRARIFERFGRGRDAHLAHAEGFGLGLSIVTAIARAHGGDAWLDDVYRDGARFVLYVPAEPPAASDDTADGAEPTLILPLDLPGHTDAARGPGRVRPTQEV